MQRRTETELTADAPRQDMSPVEKAWIWVGRVLSAFPVFMMGMSAFMKFTRNPGMVGAWHSHFMFPDESLFPIALAEVTSAVLYLIPQTAVLGAVLVTGYLGGAIASHVRAGDPFWMPLGLGIAAWAGLFLRDARVRRLLPFRQL